MASEGETSAVPRQSVFISYASEDRAAGRVLRDALTTAGLEVWFDENELGGGDAWDQKIRKQIRDCDYFMPVISAMTEQRKEGYFRREWRLAVERTMDMADDVLFLLPVVIDDTTQAQARVPDRFLAVQWLRLRGGQPNDTLASLIRRMQLGDHRLPPPFPRTSAPFMQPPPIRPPAATEEAKEPHQLPMLPFPHLPEKPHFGDFARFIAEIVWWVINSIWSLVQRLPKWARIVLLVWLIIMLMKSISSITPPDSSQRPGRTTPFSEPPTRSSRNSNSAQSAEVRRALKKAASEMGSEKKGPSSTTDFAKFGQKVAESLAAVIDDASEKHLAIIPFQTAVDDTAESKAIDTIFNAFFGKMVVALSEGVGLVKKPYAGTSDADLVHRGESLDSEFILHADIDRTSETHTLSVRLIKVSDKAVAWTGIYPLANADVTAIADQIATGVLGALPKK